MTVDKVIAKIIWLAFFGHPVDAYLLKNNLAEFHPDLHHLKRRCLRFFEEVPPTRKEER